MLIKAGVDISRLERNTRRSLTVIAEIFEDEDLVFVITSTYEGNHSAGSLHYANQAYDMAAPAAKTKWMFNRIRSVLSEDFDFVDELDHWHIEYDPN
ncbi:hypothetical protein ES702_06539 [subsurface metagenome]